MKLPASILLFIAPISAFAQSRDDGARDADDIMNFLIQSKIVEFKPNLSRDPFSVPADLTSTKQGWLIDEITIKGRMVVRNKPFAIILDPYQQAREIPVGFRFLDGELKSITENAIVFNQWDPNSSNRSGMRAVTKYFKREEDK